MADFKGGKLLAVIGDEVREPPALLASGAAKNFIFRPLCCASKTSDSGLVYD